MMIGFVEYTMDSQQLKRPEATGGGKTGGRK
jgi:hypothetical protein